MAFKTRKISRDVEAAKTRLAAMKEIDKARATTVNYGGEDAPLTAPTVAQQITDHETDTESYNGLLDQIDKLGNKLAKDEKAIRDSSARVLAGASSKFGRDSDEVEQIGGKRLSERKRPVRKPKPAA